MNRRVFILVSAWVLSLVGASGVSGAQAAAAQAGSDKGGTPAV